MGSKGGSMKITKAQSTGVTEWWLARPAPKGPHRVCIWHFKQSSPYAGTISCCRWIASINRPQIAVSFEIKWMDGGVHNRFLFILVLPIVFLCQRTEPMPGLFGEIPNGDSIPGQE